MIKEGFDCSWSDLVLSGHPNVPTKNGSTALWMEFYNKIKNCNFGVKKFLIGVHQTGDNKWWTGTGGNTVDGDGGDAINLDIGRTCHVFHDDPWSSNGSTPLLLVRPL